MTQGETSFYPEPAPELLSSNPLGYFKFLGPGLIIASVTVSGGETVFAARGGAIFGTSLLWCFFFGALLKALQVYSGMRVMTLSGHHPAYYWARMQGPKAWFPILFLAVGLILIPAGYAALAEFLATFLGSLLHPTTSNLGFATDLLASLLLLGAVLLAQFGSYQTLERTQTAIILIFLTAIGISFLALRPDIAQLLKNFFVPSIPRYPDWIRLDYPTIASRSIWVEVMTYIGVVGGTSIDYLGYLSFLRDKGWGRAGRGKDFPNGLSSDEIERGKRWLRAPLFDVLVSFGSVALLTSLFTALGAIILFPAKKIPHDSEILTVQADFMTQLHPSLFPLYAIGIFLVFFGTMYGGIRLHTRSVWECYRAIFASSETRVEPVRKRLSAYILVSGLALIWSDWAPLSIFTLVSIVGGVLSCGVWCFAMLWVDRKYLPRPVRMGPWLGASLLVAGSLMALLGLRALYDFLV